jgi:hypothetical protein
MSGEHKGMKRARTQGQDEKGASEYQFDVVGIPPGREQPLLTSPEM